MKLEGDEAQLLIADKITRLLADSTHWESIFWDAAEGSLWRKTYPNSGAHGGGSPELETITHEELAELPASRNR